MRRRWIAMALPLVAGTAVVTGEAVAAPANSHAHRANLPKLITESGYRGIRPRIVAFSGDGGNIVAKLRWSKWNDSEAIGHGTSDIQGCVPNCASGSETPEKTTVIFSRPRHGHWTKVVELKHTLPRYVAYYGRDDGWPEGAEQR